MQPPETEPTKAASSRIELAADRARRGTPGLDDGGERHVMPLGLPAGGLFQNLLMIEIFAHAALLSGFVAAGALSASISAASESML